MEGRIGYSFDSLFVLGLADYAHEVDAIETCVPPPQAGPLYRAGFNQRMLAKIRDKVGVDFPDGYIRRFLAEGWLDLTHEQPLICPVHGTPLTTTIIPFELVFPFTMPRPKFDWEVAAETKFPFPGTTKKVDAVLFPRPKNARLRACDACSEAERQWWAAQKARK